MGKIQSLIRMLVPMHNKQGPSLAVKVKFANLIDEEVYIDSINIKVDTDLGFFEKWGNFYFKNYTLDLGMQVAQKNLEATATAVEVIEEEEGFTPMDCSNMDKASWEYSACVSYNKQEQQRIDDKAAAQEAQEEEWESNRPQ